jgi:hypothetical protein
MFPAVDFSCWLLVAITVERAIAVCWPLKVYHHCTTNTAIIVILVLAAMAIVYSVHLLIGMDIVDIGANETDDRFTCIPKTAEYVYFFEITWSYLNLALINLGPFCILTIGNVCIIIKIKYGKRPASTSSDNPDSRRLDGFTLKVIVLSVVFVVCMTPVNIYFMYVSLFGHELKINGKERRHMSLSGPL